ncbi:MAG: IS630 family transposase [Candidatus Aquirickettsiella gammari]|uniref:IS630 family transposase n=1 Tax=Candidatus Aquirickettsiella gammari TaxID=2016198 RepID=A0A370CHR7_9COXI|nr:MAG: IS630 family transposase [Candidatus Aquirickettsiella gammari]
MIKLKLNEEEKAALNRLRRIQKSNQGERATYVLLSNAGKSVSEIANHINRNAHTVRLWLKRYATDGIKGLQTRKKLGRPAKKAPVIDSQLSELLTQSPQAYGYQEAGWQINLLRDWFKKHGLSACENTIVKSLNKLGFVYKRFSKTVPSNTPSAFEKKAGVAKLVEEIKNQSKKEAVEIFFSDESHFSNQPYVSRGWFKRGEKK